VDYLKHFGLERDPFGREAHAGFHFECPAHADAEQRVLRGPLLGRGLTVLVGEHGSGKTTLLRRLVEALPEARFEPAVLVIVHRDVDPTALLQRLARPYGVSAPSPDRPALLGQLAGRLAQIQEQGRHAVAVLDEAHLLGSTAILEELRGLLNLEGDRGPLLSLVLSGLPELDQRLGELPALLARVDVRVRLGAMDADTAAQYLAARIRFAGGKPEILHPAAVTEMHRAGRGVPRVLDTLADNALYEACRAGRGAVVVEDVQRASWDLGVGAGGAELVETAEPIVAPLDADDSEYATTIPDMAPLRAGEDIV
jgi:type II secretory pathway predicted ATPase ExeA